jgi:hypothetical protein
MKRIKTAKTSVDAYSSITRDTRHSDAPPMLANLIKVGLLLVGMPGEDGLF